MAGKLIIHGLTGFMVGGTLKFFLNGTELGSVPPKETVEFDIFNGGKLTLKCGINPSKPSLEIEDGYITEITCKYNRVLGTFVMEKTSINPMGASGAQVKEPEKPIYEMKGARGKYIRVYEDKCVIGNKASFTTFIVGNGTDGEKTIYYQDVIGVQFKPCGFSIGYIQLETASAQMNNKNNNFWNENSFTFEKDVDKAQKIAKYLQERVDECKKSKNAPTVVNQQLSSADELKKFKELLDVGIITQEEFDAKKKQLLGL